MLALPQLSPAPVGLARPPAGWVSGRVGGGGMHYSWLAPDRVHPGRPMLLTPMSSPPVPRRPAGSLPTRRWWPSTAGSVAVRAVPRGYRLGRGRAGTPMQEASDPSGEGEGPRAMGSHGLGGGMKFPGPWSASPWPCRVLPVPCSSGGCEEPHAAASSHLVPTTLWVSTCPLSLGWKQSSLRPRSVSPHVPSVPLQ